MRILIAPCITNDAYSSSFYLAGNLADLFYAHNHAVAVSAPSGTPVHNVSLYPCNRPSPPLFHKKSTARTNEEWLYKKGCLSRRYLQQDLEYLLESFRSFNPDIVLSIDRPMAEAAARILNIRCFAFVHPAMYTGRSFDSRILSPLNQILSENNLEQIITLKDLSAIDELRFGFGPPQLMPFLKEDKVIRIGLQKEFIPKSVHTNRVCIYLEQIKRPAHHMRQIILDAFHGAPYAVYASYTGSNPETIENVHFLSHPDPNLIPGSIAVIHDGNDYYCNLCLAKGIVQVIVTNYDFIRLYNAKAVNRCKTGQYLYEENLSMESLYSTYRTVLSDDDYDINSKSMQKQVSRCGNLSQLLSFL